MTIISGIQKEFFQRIRSILPSHLSLVDEITEILNISDDSAYRRIRCEKQLSIDEFYLLCKHFNISSDEILSRRSDKICFRSYLLDEKEFRFEQYLEAILRDIKSLSEQKNPQIIFVLNELNLFQMMQVPEVAAFKFFFWSKSILSFSDYKDQLFTANRLDDKLRKLSMEILNYYVKIPTIELMTEEALSSMMKQICFYHEAGFFKGDYDTNSLCDKLVDLMNHMRQQADLGFKFIYGIDPVGQEGNYMLYYNDLVLTDNTILLTSDETRMTCIMNNIINLLLTDNPGFYERTYKWGKNLISKSTLISGSAEKERYKFFRGAEDQINKLRKRVCT